MSSGSEGRVNLQFSDEQQLFSEALTRFVDERCSFDARRATIAGGEWGDETLWHELAQLGCLGVSVPESAGGFGGGAIEMGLVARATGRRLLVEPVLPALVAGVLLSGVSGGQDAIDGLVSGEQRFAIAADRTCRSVEGGMAATAFLLPTDAGMTIVPAHDVQRTPVRLLDDTLAADVSMIGHGTHHAAADDWRANRARAAAVARTLLCWQAVGSMERALADTAAHLRERRQFGKALSEFQVVQHRIAEMAVAVKEAEVAALLAALTLDAAGPGLPTERAVAAAAHCIVAGADVVANGAVQLHGGMGVSDELDISARFRQLQAVRARLRDDGGYADRVIAAKLHRTSAVLEAA